MMEFIAGYALGMATIFAAPYVRDYTVTLWKRIRER